MGRRQEVAPAAKLASLGAPGAGGPRQTIGLAGGDARQSGPNGRARARTSNKFAIVKRLQRSNWRANTPASRRAA